MLLKEGKKETNQKKKGILEHGCFTCRGTESWLVMYCWNRRVVSVSSLCYLVKVEACPSMSAKLSGRCGFLRTLIIVCCICRCKCWVVHYTWCLCLHFSFQLKASHNVQELVNDLKCSGSKKVGWDGKMKENNNNSNSYINFGFYFTAGSTNQMCLVLCFFSVILFVNMHPIVHFRPAVYS